MRFTISRATTLAGILTLAGCGGEDEGQSKWERDLSSGDVILLPESPELPPETGERQELVVPPPPEVGEKSAAGVGQESTSPPGSDPSSTAEPKIRKPEIVQPNPEDSQAAPEPTLPPKATVPPREKNSKSSAQDPKLLKPETDR